MSRADENAVRESGGGGGLVLWERMCVVYVCSSESGGEVEAEWGR